MKALERATVGRQSWFFRRFRAPARWQGKCVQIRLGAVDYRAQFYLNGKWLGEHEGHFSPVALDASDALRCGQDNLLAVRIDAFPYDSPQPASVVGSLRAQFARSQNQC